MNSFTDARIPREIRDRARRIGASGGRLSLRQLVADVGRLHRDPANAGASFQVASQFNLLEMVGPEVTPEEGVGRYEQDHSGQPAQDARLIEMTRLDSLSSRLQKYRLTERGRAVRRSGSRPPDCRRRMIKKR